MVVVTGIAGPVHLPQGAAERVDFTFIRVLLTLENLQHLEHLFHVVKRGSQDIDNGVDFLDRLLHR
jgi:hypothetical protein